jgi:hypothetical protein
VRRTVEHYDARSIQGSFDQGSTHQGREMMMNTLKGILAVCLFGIVNSAAHAELQCGKGDETKMMSGQKMCCSSGPAKDKAKGACVIDGNQIVCGQRITGTETVCEDILSRSRRLKKEQSKKEAPKT